MRPTLLADVLEYPHAFHWTGPIDSGTLDEWVASSRFPIPATLRSIWESFGSGDMFESETLFAPLGGGLDDIDHENDYLYAQGMPPRFLAFHRGFFISAIDQVTGEIVRLEARSLTERQRFANLDDWYVSTLRAEFAERYGLSRS